MDLNFRVSNSIWAHSAIGLERRRNLGAVRLPTVFQVFNKRLGGNRNRYLENLGRNCVRTEWTARDAVSGQPPQNRERRAQTRTGLRRKRSVERDRLQDCLLLKRGSVSHGIANSEFPSTGAAAA
jgi:hypothetical protein